MSSEEKNYITPQGFAKLRAEYDHLKRRERPQVVEVVSWAAGNGDRSENGDYIYGKRRLREIDKRLRYLQKQLDAAEVVDPTKVTSSKIVFGATVEIEDEEGRKKTYRIVGVDESEPEKGKISWKSPIARALMRNGREGEFITFQSPQGEREIEVLSVRYVEIPE